MSRGNEQNLEDFLKSLREATEQDIPTEAAGGRKRAEKLSAEDLQSRLKSLYQSENGSVATDTEVPSYTLDEEFLKEAQAVKTEEKIAVQAPKEIVSAEVLPEDDRTEARDDDLPPWEEPPTLTEPLAAEELFAPVELLVEELATEDPPVEDEIEEPLREVLPVEIAMMDLDEDEELVPADVFAAEEGAEEESVDGDTNLDEDFFGEEEDFSSIQFADDEFEEEDFFVEDVKDDRSYEEEGAIALLEESEEGEILADTEEADDAFNTELPMEEEALEEVFAVSSLPIEAGDDFAREEEPLTEEAEPPMSEDEVARITEAMDEPTLDLMLQLGCVSELEQTLGEKTVQEHIAEQYEEDVPLDMRSFSRDDGENADSAANDEENLFKARKEYHKRQTRMSWRLVGTVLSTLALMVYELLPLFGIEYGGILDYHQYPVSYVLIGLQLFVLCVGCSASQLWSSLKNTFFLKPNGYSAAALGCLAVLAYDFVLIFASVEEKPFVFHFAGACLVTVSVLSEQMLLKRERNSFEVFFSHRKQYTLSPVSGADSLAEQMAKAEGKDSLSVYAPASAAVSERGCRSFKDDNEHKIYYSCFVAFVLAAVLGVASVCLGAEALVAFRLALVAFLAMLPVSAVFQLAFALVYSSARLARRDCAVADNESIHRYADCQVLLLRDLHLFAKCHAKQAGIVFFREDQTRDTMTCLHALYSAIGGPMEGVFEELPEAFRIKSIRIHRIAKNGIEALADEKHILLVGDRSFMARYGVVFADDGPSRKVNSTLYVSLDGEATAKISIRYSVQPTFEMLVDRLAKEGIRCVVETYDPLINSAMVAKLRGDASVPVSVLHKNASDFNRRGQKRRFDNEPVGLVAGSSRLKLAELAVWCCRIRRMQQSAVGLSIAFSSFALLLVGCCVGFLTVGAEDLMTLLNQLSLVLYGAASMLIGIVVTLSIAPPKRYFVTDEYLREKEAEYEREEKKSEKKTKKRK